MSVAEYSCLAANWDGFWVERCRNNLFTVYHKGFWTKDSSISSAKRLLKDAYSEAIQRLEREAAAEGF